MTAPHGISHKVPSRRPPIANLVSFSVSGVPAERPSRPFAGGIAGRRCAKRFPLRKFKFWATTAVSRNGRVTADPQASTPPATTHQRPEAPRRPRGRSSSHCIRPAGAPATLPVAAFLAPGPPVRFASETVKKRSRRGLCRHRGSNNGRQDCGPGPHASIDAKKLDPTRWPPSERHRATPWVA